MALTIDATAKGASANSYVTLAEAETYVEGRLDVADWDADTDDNKNRALRMATDLLDAEDWRGSPSDQDQRLKWPRLGTYDEDAREYDSDAVPRPVKEATYEYALMLIAGTLEVKPTGLEQFENVKVGSLDVTPRASYRAAKMPDPVRRLISHLLLSSGELSARTVRT
jgi:hypothetical protein